MMLPGSVNPFSSMIDLLLFLWMMQTSMYLQLSIGIECDGRLHTANCSDVNPTGLEET
jgi:hypothetical protein